MQRKRLLIALLVLAALIVAAMFAVLLVTELQQRDLSPVDGIESTEPPVTTPQVTLPLAAPTEAPTIAPDAVLPTGENTPVDTVKRYLDRWNAKDEEGMEACLAEAVRGQRDHEMENVELIEVLRIVEQMETEESFPEGLAAEAHAVAFVLTDYTIHYSEIGKSFFMVDSAAREAYKFWLTQMEENAPWLIALQGY